MARIDPVRGSSTIPVAQAARDDLRVWASTDSTLAWMVVSSVSVTSRPGTGRWSCTVSSACPIGSCTTTSRPGRSLEHLVVLLFDPGEARALGAAGAGHLGVPEHLRPEPVERVPAGQLRDGRDAGQVLGHDPGGDLGLELAQHPAPAPAQLILDRLHVVRPRGVRPVLLLLVMLGVVALLELVEAEGAGDDHGGVVRVREQSLVRDDRLRRLLLGQVLAVRAQDRPAQARQPPDVALLRDGLLRKRGRVDDLDLRRPEHDDGERRQRERQHKPQPAVRHPRHGAARPPDDLVESRTCFVESAFAGTIP